MLCSRRLLLAKTFGVRSLHLTPFSFLARDPSPRSISRNNARISGADKGARLWRMLNALLSLPAVAGELSLRRHSYFRFQLERFALCCPRNRMLLTKSP